MYETLTKKELCENLKTDEKEGLTRQEAQRRLKEEGKNILKKGKEITVWDMVQEQLNEPMIFILFWQRRSPCCWENLQIRGSSWQSLP